MPVLSDQEIIKRCQLNYLKKNKPALAETGGLLLGELFQESEVFNSRDNLQRELNKLNSVYLISLQEELNKPFDQLKELIKKAQTLLCIKNITSVQVDSWTNGVTDLNIQCYKVVQQIKAYQQRSWLVRLWWWLTGNKQSREVKQKQAWLAVQWSRSLYQYGTGIASLNSNKQDLNKLLSSPFEILSSDWQKTIKKFAAGVVTHSMYFSSANVCRRLSLVEEDNEMLTHEVELVEIKKMDSDAFWSELCGFLAIDISAVISIRELKKRLDFIRVAYSQADILKQVNFYNEKLQEFKGSCPKSIAESYTSQNAEKIDDHYGIGKVRAIGWKKFHDPHINLLLSYVQLCGAVGIPYTEIKMRSAITAKDFSSSTQLIEYEHESKGTEKSGKKNILDLMLNWQPQPEPTKELTDLYKTLIQYNKALQSAVTLFQAWPDAEELVIQLTPFLDEAKVKFSYQLGQAAYKAKVDYEALAGNVSKPIGTVHEQAAFVYLCSLLGLDDPKFVSLRAIRSEFKKQHSMQNHPDKFPTKYQDDSGEWHAYSPEAYKEATEAFETLFATFNERYEKLPNQEIQMPPTLLTQDAIKKLTEQGKIDKEIMLKWREANFKFAKDFDIKTKKVTIMQQQITTIGSDLTVARSDLTAANSKMAEMSSQMTDLLARIARLEQKNQQQQAQPLYIARMGGTLFNNHPIDVNDIIVDGVAVEQQTQLKLENSNI